MEIRTPSVQALETLDVGVDLAEIRILEAISIQLHGLYSNYPLALGPSVPAEISEDQPTRPLYAHMDVTPFECRCRHMEYWGRYLAYDSALRS